jgi:hypothetical protein
VENIEKGREVSVGKHETGGGAGYLDRRIRMKTSELTDKELLELSAKAAGIDATFRWDGYGRGAMVCDDKTRWNPLTTDGDALRLAVKLGIDIAQVQIDFWDKDSTDPYAATRRAIVRAAAEIGKGMNCLT